jgi:hypothetical protein
LLYSLEVFRSGLTFVPEGSKARHSLTTYFKNQKLDCTAAYGGDVVSKLLGDGEVGAFALSAVDICLKDDRGTYGASFATEPPLGGDASLPPASLEWMISGFCLRVEQNDLTGIPSDPRITVRETWEIWGLP